MFATIARSAGRSNLRHTLLLAGLLLLAQGCGGRLRALAAGRAAGQTLAGQTAGTTREEILSGDQVRHYRLHVPPSYQQGNPVALILNLHGFDETAEQQERLSGMSAAADANGFIAVYPEGLGSPPRWYIGRRGDGQQDLAFLRAVIDQVSARYSVDQNRIYATGISNGGGMVNRLGCDLADRIAAIAPVSGDYQGYQNCAPGRPVPVIAFHGTADRLIPYQGKPAALLPPIHDWAAAWAARDGCNPTAERTYTQGEVRADTWDGCSDGATVTLYTIDGGGHTWPGSVISFIGHTTHDVDATAAMWQFFVAHPRPGQ